MKLYKILPRRDWDRARVAGSFDGSPVDRADGFIHFSTAAQAQETAARHFRGVEDLVVLAVDVEAIEAAGAGALRWEVSRGGALFAHLYAPLSVEAVRAVTPAPLGEDGAPQLGRLEA